MITAMNTPNVFVMLETKFAGSNPEQTIWISQNGSYVIEEMPLEEATILYYQLEQALQAAARENAPEAVATHFDPN